MCLAILFAAAQNNIKTPATNKTATTNVKTTETTKTSGSVTKTSIKKGELKKAITNNLKKDFPQYNVTGSYKLVNKKNKTTYEVIIAKGTQKEDLTYSKDGIFLSKEVVKKGASKNIQKKTAPKTTTKQSSPKK